MNSEIRALQLGTLGNSVGAVAALVFYLRSGSDALLLDGLYTAVMAGASVIAGQVNRAALQPRSRAYPFGASGQEPLYVLFRTLVLLGIIAFAVVSAIGKILTAVQGGVIPAVQLDGLGWYFSAMVLLNLWLWRVFARSWSNGGGNNDMLRGMAISARFDALISAGTGIALLGSPSLLATPLAPLVPIADSLLVLVLSLALVGEPIAILQGAVTEAAGSSRSIPQGLHSSCSAAVAAVLAERGCTLLELAMIRLGRTVTAVAYVEPATAVTASQTDGLRLDVEAELVQTLQTPVLCEVIATSVHPYAEPAN
ncbi:cation transporter [Vulcanococcus sp.]|uniref:cation transporter n=1 Tax=Vulcanococcus sp. TaxID=2856995 RepID=UPI0037DA18CB